MISNIRIFTCFLALRLALRVYSHCDPACLMWDSTVKHKKTLTSIFCVVTFCHQWRGKVRSNAKYIRFFDNYKDIFSDFHHQCRRIVQNGHAATRQKASIFQFSWQYCSEWMYYILYTCMCCLYHFSSTGMWKNDAIGSLWGDMLLFCFIFSEVRYHFSSTST